MLPSGFTFFGGGRFRSIGSPARRPGTHRSRGQTGKRNSADAEYAQGRSEIAACKSYRVPARSRLKALADWLKPFGGLVGSAGHQAPSVTLLLREVTPEFYPLFSNGRHMADRPHDVLCPV